MGSKRISPLMKSLPLLAALVLTLCAAWGRTPLKRDRTPIRPMLPSINRNVSDKVFLEKADVLRKGRLDDFQEVVGNVEFRKGGMFLFCDSALFFTNDSIECFGNVRMQQGDTLFVYADELVYGDSSQIATLYAEPGKLVRLVNRDVQLTTEIFNYDLLYELGYYDVGGTLWDKENKLTSWYGEYSPSSKEALFSDDVHLHSLRQKDPLDIYTDEMIYNTATHTALLDTVSRIVSKDGTIYTSYGIYNTQTQQADLYSRSLVKASNGNTLTGDTLYYDRSNGVGHAMGNIVLTDSANHAILTGERGYYYELRDSAIIWGRALARQFTTDRNSDTIYLHADTIRTRMIVTPAKYEADTLVAAADTTHHIIGAPHVRFYRTDLQGICDSMTIVQKDSMLYMDRHPVVWSDRRQIFGNRIEVHLQDSTADWARLPEFGFMAELIEDEFYNQMSGKEMYATFENQSIRHLDVSGNVEVIYLPQENDSTYNKIANVESSFLAADFTKQQIDRMKMWPETHGTMTPLYLAKKNLFYLPQFRWLEALRPKDPMDVFNISPEMLQLFSEPPFGSRQ